MKFSLFKNICWGNWLFFIIVTFLFVISVLSACGTKGNLSIPDKSSKIMEPQSGLTNQNPFYRV